MRKLVFILTLMACCMVGLTGHAAVTGTVQINDSVSMSLSGIIAKGLPVLVVETVDHEEPTCDYVSAPAGCMGQTIRNATKVPGRLVMYQRIVGVDSVTYDSGDYVKDVSGMTIKIRGNTSAYHDKKPYKIKLQKKKDLLLRGNEDVYEDKEWLLIRDQFLLTTAGFIVSDLLGMPWTPGHHFVNVVFNGEYRGVYLLCESVKRNPDCRINVDKTSGYIFECDPYWWNEDVYVTSVTKPKYNFTFKYPDSDDILPEQLAYMQTVVTAYENSLGKSDYPDKIDVVSFATWCLAHDLMGTQDSGGANRYYSKFDSSDTSLIEMPVLWDFDMAERTTSEWSRCHTSHFDQLFANANRRFVDEYVAQWRRVSSTFKKDFSTAMNAFSSSAQGRALKASTPLENLRWNTTMSVPNNVYYRINWYNKRVEWIDPAITALNPVGDVNVDGKVEIADVTLLIDALLGVGSSTMHAHDVNGDGQVTIADVTDLIDLLLAGA